MTDVHNPTLSELVTAHPAAARVLEGYDLDYCCHGDRTLAVACAQAGIDVDEVEGRLTELPREDEASWASLAPPALADHIVEAHHRYLQEELPLLDELATKILVVHGERHPELAEVAHLVGELRADLEPHMLKEERVLFPAIAAIVEGFSDFPFGSVENPIRMMRFEHDRAGGLLASLRGATGGYAVPDDACASYRSLYLRLAALEVDTHLHIHKENAVLFPAVLQMVDAA